MNDKKKKNTRTKELNSRKRSQRIISNREAIEAAARLKTDFQGNRYVIRFTVAERLEHVLLIISFTLLGLTGLLQRYADTRSGELLLKFMGGIDIARQIHHIFAAVFFLEAVYHVGIFLYNLVVYRRIGSLWPEFEDIRHFMQVMRLNLGLSKEHPNFGRFNFEEKVEYWALIWGTVVMGITGVMQWFPAFVTRWLPGSSIPVARALHSLEAVLAVLAILIWHLYHTVIKTVNKSIFTGTMTEKEMLEEHPAELRYLEQASAALWKQKEKPETTNKKTEDNQ